MENLDNELNKDYESKVEDRISLINELREENLDFYSNFRVWVAHEKRFLPNEELTEELYYVYLLPENNEKYLVEYDTGVKCSTTNKRIYEMDICQIDNDFFVVINRGPTACKIMGTKPIVPLTEEEKRKIVLVGNGNDVSEFMTIMRQNRMN